MMGTEAEAPKQAENNAILAAWLPEKGHRRFGLISKEKEPVGFENGTGYPNVWLDA
jgi:hypothetical protein